MKLQGNYICRSQWLRHILFIGLGFVVSMLIIIGAQSFYRWKLVQKLNLSGLETELYDVAYITSKKCQNIDYDIINTHYNYPVQPYVYRDGRDSSLELETVLSTLIREDNQVKIVYLELDPSYHNTDEMISLIAQQSGTLFHIILRPYSMDEWVGIAQEGRLDVVLQEYKNLAERVVSIGNTDVFYYGNKDWLTNNPMYFDNPTQISKDALMEMYTEINMNVIIANALTEETISSEIIAPDFEVSTYVDLQGANIYYLGDSMYGKDKNQSGIVEITTDYLNATGYNWAIMGTSITGDTDEDFMAMVHLLLEQGTQNNTPNIIVLRYGFNDYSTQATLEDDGKFVTNLKEGIGMLQDTFPDTDIILSTPTICSSDYGYDIELEQYVAKIQEIATKLNVYCLNNYNVDIFTEGDPNWTLIDRVHYTAKGRFRQAERLAEYISSIYKN